MRFKTLWMLETFKKGFRRLIRGGTQFYTHTHSSWLLANPLYTQAIRQKSVTQLFYHLQSIHSRCSETEVCLLMFLACWLDRRSANVAPLCISFRYSRWWRVGIWNKDEGVLDTRVLATHEAQSGQSTGTGQHVERMGEKSSVTDSEDIENSQGKHLSSSWEGIITGLPGRRRRNLDDALQALPGWWDTPIGTHGGQENKEKFCQVHSHRQGVVQTRVHPPNLGMCEWRPMWTNKGRSPRRDMRESYRWSICSIEGHSCEILLVDHKGRLHEVRTSV